MNGAKAKYRSYGLYLDCGPNIVVEERSQAASLIERTDEGPEK